MRDNSFIMKAKSILKIAAFSIAFISSIALAGVFADENDVSAQFFVPFKTETVVTYGNDQPFLVADAVEAAKIGRLLQKDDDNGRARSLKLCRASEDCLPPFSDDTAFAAYADATARYAAQSGKIERNDLSPLFKSAWGRHMKAWRDYADFLEAMKISAAREELGAQSFNEFNREYNDEISSSWDEVLRFADASGAETLQYRNLAY